MLFALSLGIDNKTITQIRVMLGLGRLIHAVSPRSLCLTLRPFHTRSAKAAQHLPAASTTTSAGDLMASDTGIPRVLCIQSHVVHGYVGGKCAVLTLQLLGFEVDPVYSVQFSNHTEYPHFKGAVFDGEHLQNLLAGLELNGITSYSHLLTGYVKSASLLKVIGDACRKMREWNKDLTYVCDPVMGDNGRLYVPQDVVDAFRTDILPLASILTPNQFEAETLTGHSICTPAEGFEACRELQARGPHTVVITSTSFPSDPDHILLLASTTLTQARGPSYQQITMAIPRLKGYFAGTGDLLTALLLGRLHQRPDDLASAIEQAVAALQAVLLDTATRCGEAIATSARSSEVCNKRELRLIQNQRHIAEPHVALRCEPYREQSQQEQAAAAASSS